MDDRLMTLRKILIEEKNWPLLYYFKFIVPSDNDKINSVKGLFSDPSKITYNPSRDINYIGISCKEFMPDAESIIAIYEKASLVEGLIAL
jgi:uncharacterized protein